MPNPITPAPPRINTEDVRSIPWILYGSSIFGTIVIKVVTVPTSSNIPVAIITIEADLDSSVFLIPNTTPASIRLGAPEIDTI